MVKARKSNNVGITRPRTLLKEVKTIEEELAN
jgi:hypothetical protein